MRVAVVTGGVGGAKMVLGLSEFLGGEHVTAIVNVGDDFEHFGLSISPDLDTLLYTLAGKANADQGWGRSGETWTFMEVARSLGGVDWFALGDGDLALHVMRSEALRRGETLSQVMARFAAEWGVTARMLPVTDDALRTVIDSDEGLLAFQTYFVERRCTPLVRRIAFEGAEASRPAPGVLDALAAAEAIVIAPSNPWLSVDPVLAVPGIREALQASSAPVIAVSPVRGGQAFKGPTAKIMGELGLAVDSAAIAAHYSGLIDGMIVDRDDDLSEAELAVRRTDIAMPTVERKRSLAAEVVAMARELADR
jgi:LPPG:FO 2-phospho-L-lactate transferase